MLNKKNLKKGEVYAVNHGDHAGQMFIIVETGKDTVNCLSVPDMKNVKVPFEAFEHGRNSDIISYVECLSRDIFKVIKAQYNRNSENFNH